jgi:hypothetical protein
LFLLYGVELLVFAAGGPHAVAEPDLRPTVDFVLGVDLPFQQRRFDVVFKVSSSTTY